MSEYAAQQFIWDLATDGILAEEFAARRSDPEAVKALLAEKGYNATPEEIKDVFFEAYGQMLSEEQLAAVAGGISDAELAAVIGIGVFAGVAAATASAAAV